MVGQTGDLKVVPGSPRPLGASWNKQGVNFALFSSNATRVEVCLFDAVSGAETARFDLPGRTDDVWHGQISRRRAGPGTHYAFRVHGPFDPANGHRFDATVPLIDPCARGLSTRLPLRARIVDPDFHWEGDRHPTIPWRDTVIYELHVKGFTQLHPAVPEKWRGKYLGLTVAPVIEHLKSIGVTAVELLPCQSFVSEQFVLDRGLTNYWGYNPVAWFAPANEYAVDDAVAEFKTIVRTLHASGIEVVLDVVFNHTAEGGESGPLLSWRGIDNSVYYRLNAADPRSYENLTGCGNTVNCEHPRVRALIVECLKYWSRRCTSMASASTWQRCWVERRPASTRTRHFSRRCAPSRLSPTSNSSRNPGTWAREATSSATSPPGGPSGTTVSATVYGDSGERTPGSWGNLPRGWPAPAICSGTTGESPRPGSIS